jgi:hypothetical protein
MRARRSAGPPAYAAVWACAPTVGLHFAEPWHALLVHPHALNAPLSPAGIACRWRQPPRVAQAVIQPVPALQLEQRVPLQLPGQLARRAAPPLAAPQPLALQLPGQLARPSGPPLAPPPPFTLRLPGQLARPSAPPRHPAAVWSQRRYFDPPR